VNIAEITMMNYLKNVRNVVLLYLRRTKQQDSKNITEIKDGEKCVPIMELWSITIV